MDHFARRGNFYGHPFYSHKGADYITFLKNTLPAGNPFQGLKIVLDCANGATYRIAPELFAELGAQVESLAVQPDGININDHCGSDDHSGRLVEAEGDV